MIPIFTIYSVSNNTEITIALFMVSSWKQNSEFALEADTAACVYQNFFGGASDPWLYLHFDRPRGRIYLRRPERKKFYTFVKECAFDTLSKRFLRSAYLYSMFYKPAQRCGRFYVRPPFASTAAFFLSLPADNFLIAIPIRFSSQDRRGHKPHRRKKFRRYSLNPTYKFYAPSFHSPYNFAAFLS